MSCRDQPGIIASVTEFIHKNGGNIMALEQHVDQGAGNFFMRAQWELDSFTIPKEKIEDYFHHLVGERFQADYRIHYTGIRPKVAIFVSKYAHCLFDLLARWEAGELEVDIPLVIGNHTDLQAHVERLGIPFVHLAMTKDNKAEQEAKTKELLSSHEVDFMVLARYMQILSEDFTASYPNKIINIHHSFLPAFKGAKPYHSAFERGVKIIGATSHYVTADLDQGPIIEQDVVRVSHIDRVENLIKKGKDLEKIVLARAVEKHIERKTLVFENRTIIFN